MNICCIFYHTCSPGNRNLLLGLFDISIADQVVSKEFSVIDRNYTAVAMIFQNIVKSFAKLAGRPKRPL